MLEKGEIDFIDPNNLWHLPDTRSAMQKLSVGTATAYRSSNPKTIVFIDGEAHKFTNTEDRNLKKLMRDVGTKWKSS